MFKFPIELPGRLGGKCGMKNRSTDEPVEQMRQPHFAGRVLYEISIARCGHSLAAGTSGVKFQR
jgi:hypothetical protein